VLVLVVGESAPLRERCEPLETFESVVLIGGRYPIPVPMRVI
jgi:hypothetical protein